MTTRVERGTFRRSCRRCGWERTYSTKAMADARKRTHKCDYHLEKAQRTERHRQKLEAIDRTPTPCLHKNVTHERGTNPCYVLDKCRCYPCSAARVETDRTRNRQQAYGRYDRYVDAEPARQHIRSLMQQGMGLKRIVAASDLSQGMIWKLLYGKRRADGSRTPSKRILRTTEARVLAVQLDLADGALIDATGSRRRVQALVALGWSQSKIAERIGMLRSNFRLADPSQTTITVAHDRALRSLYDELSMKLPPEGEWRDKIAASRARRYAKERGWLPPLAWDDELIDDPSHEPQFSRDGSHLHSDDVDEAAILRRMNGDRSVRLSKADSAELVRRWQASGRSLSECERHTGVNPHRWIAKEGAA